MLLFSIKPLNRRVMSVFTAARGAYCCLSFTTDSSPSATHPEETHTAGKMLHNNTLL